jgi:choline dehydrogenase
MLMFSARRGIIVELLLCLVLLLHPVVTVSQEECDFDYVVVGSGPGGCVFTRRAAEQGYKVHLLERGRPKENSKIPPNERVGLFFSPRDVRIPFNAIIASLPTAGEFLFTAETASLPGNPSAITTIGNTLGGGSTINGMFYGRPNLDQFDVGGDWPDNWNRSTIIRAFQFAEDASAVNTDSAARGQSGVVHTENQHYVTPLQQALLDAAASIGLPTPQDFNSIDKEDGLMLNEFPRKNGLRQDAFTAYVASAPGDVVERITVETGTEVTRIDIVNEDGFLRAKGVYATTTARLLPQRESYFCANKGVVLAAGAVHSPVLLERSGVGDATILSNLGIKLVLDNPDVGRNLQDHLTAVMTVYRKLDRDNPYSNRWTRLKERYRYVRERTGLYADSPIKTTVFFKVNNATGAGVQATITERGIVPDLYLRNGSPITIAAQCIGVKSRGEVHYSGNPRFPVGSRLVPGAPLTLDPNYAGEDEDVACLARGQKRLRELLIASGEFLGEDVPGEGFVEYGEEAFEFDVEKLRSLLGDYTSFSGYHFQSSCSLGKVVDSDTMEVFGYETLGNGTQVKKNIAGLYITDASIFPKDAKINPVGPTYAASEYGSSLILGTDFFQ